MDNVELERVVEIFGALANPIRAKIIRRLTISPADVTELTEIVGSASQPLVSHHLKILRESHLVQATRNGRSNQYSIIDDHVASIFLDALTHTKEHSNDCHH